jgi:molybdenum cofactor guanylyltransferase
VEELGIIILAGGKSSRMGEDKGLMSLFGKPMISYVIETVQDICDHIIIVSDNPNYKQFKYQVVKDVFKEKGPLGGIYSGLNSSVHEKSLLLSCDIPYIKTSLLEFLIDHSQGFDITVARYQERLHPLIGIYSKKCTDQLKNLIEENKLKISDAFQLFNTNIVDVDEFDALEFKNLNSKNDIIPM